MRNPKAVRAVFWTVVIVLVIIPWTIGMGRMLMIGRSKGTSATAGTVAGPPPLATSAAGAIAAAYATEYLSFDPADAAGMMSRTERLKAYSRAAETSVVTVKDTRAQRVLHAWPVGYIEESKDGARGSVTVQAVVQTTGGSARNVWMAVPVATDGKAWTITGLPRFTAAPDLPMVDLTVAGESVADENDEIRGVVAGFLKAYLSGTPVEVKVYMAPDTTPPKGLNGSARVQLREVGALRLTRVDGGSVDALATATLLDQETSAQFVQQFHLILTNNGGRWSIAQVK